MSGQIWNAIEANLRQIYSLPHNKVRFGGSGSSIDIEITKKLGELRSGMVGEPKKEEYLGPKRFLRVVGASNRVHSGEWWFDAGIFEGLETGYSRVIFSDQELKATLRAMLREVLAISINWNTIDEIWALELPPGERLTGYSGVGTPQKFFGTIPLTAKGNRMLVGKARQIFFPVKNPFWVKRFRDLV